MGSATRDSLAAVRADIQSGSVPLTVEAANGFFTVADSMRSVPQLRGLLSDPSTDTDTKAAIATAVFSNALPKPILDVVVRAVALRWSNGRDLERSFVQLATMVLAGSARAAGRPLALADELYAAARLFDGNRDLQLAIGGKGDKPLVRELIDELFATKVSPEALALIEYSATHSRGGRIAVALDEMVATVASFDGRTSATVITATPVSEARRAQLAAGLEKAFAEKLHVNFTTDSSIIGGVRAEVGSEVIDGTTKTKLAALRSAVVG